LTAARAVALAKASSLVGALMVGVWVGVLLTVLPLAAVSTAAADDRTTSLVGLIGSAALVAAALWLEQCCKTPDPPQQDDNVGLR
jgi:heme/copper-type cytochrome/quinol oxidase subunit 4